MNKPETKRKCHELIIFSLPIIFFIFEFHIRGAPRIALSPGRAVIYFDFCTEDVSLKKSKVCLQIMSTVFCCSKSNIGACHKNKFHQI